MDYPFENLGPERFQQFCQALLVGQFPGVQCFPIAQPDGGRDSTAFFMGGKHEDFIVFQVKFVRKPLAEADPHKWLADIAEAEAPKIRNLIPRGAKAFYLLTNIPGTAHLDAGSIDKVNKTLSSVIGVSSQCWWRDDLNRRLDTAWDLKWVYPELMTGPDLIRAIIESGLSEQKEQRSAAIKAFVRDQYDLDQEVRFKQVELQNKLLDLFIDVPVVFRHQHNREHNVYFQHQLLAIVSQQTPQMELEEVEASTATIEGAYQEPYFYRKGKAVGAAALLLHPMGQSAIPRMVLEGAPGQGKSTITQYVCQVHRMRLLKRDEDLTAIPEFQQSAPVRIPFRVDLRDLATWLGKKDPFSSEETDEPPAHWRKSLEAFLAAQVRHHSGGANFAYEDLVAVAKLSAILLVFDGLDEVADISRRQEVVDEIIKGVNRLEENSASLQVIVTSRPAAFANSPGLPDDKFPYYHLESVTRTLINEYADKWLKARRIHGRQSSEFKKILKDKLDQPHLRDLARNPMQLAILLSLIHTRGSSLPDKRTALYDNYIELFFSREAEKSPVVRDHRDLLIDIHRYLAWVLHSEAEQGHERGSVNTDRLKDLVSSYLTQEGHDNSLAEQLFTGMVERVVALVSRVEGTFEFEVQPLREYFAARFLYETAPYSPPGAERRGTKPDRFDAIARDFYWLNVTRFYAGCFSKGELPALVDRLNELAHEEGYRFITHPRALAATLLADWVFTQHPKSVKDVVALVLDGIGLRYILSTSGTRQGSGSPMVLPKNSGKDELVDRCFTLLRNNPARDYSLEILELVKANASVEECRRDWMNNVLAASGERTRWLHYGLHLGLLSQITIDDLKKILSDDPLDPERINLIFRARRIDYCEGAPQVFNAVVDAILDREIHPQPQRRTQSILDLFSHVLEPYRYTTAFTYRQPIPLSEIWARNPRKPFPSLDERQLQTLPAYDEVQKCLAVSRVAETESAHPAYEWATELNHWDNLIETSRSIWGDRWAFYHLANVSAGIKSSKETCIDFPDLLDHSRSLCRRTRYARLRAGTNSWWAKQLDGVKEQKDLMFAALVLLTWGSPATLVELAARLAEVLDSLSLENWYRMFRTVRNSIFAIHDEIRHRYISFDLQSLPNRLSERVATAFGLRARLEDRQTFYLKYLARYRGTDLIVLDFCQDGALDLPNLNTASWNPNLNLISKSYAAGVISESAALRRAVSHRQTRVVPTRVAERIASSPDKYPNYLVAFAEATCRENVATKIVPVGKIAERDRWFIE